MNSKKFYTTIFVMALLAVFLQMSLTSPNAFETAGYKGETPIVVFDVAHQNYFNNTHMQSAIDLIETKFGAEVFINTENFTFTNLRGADLLILPAPYNEATNPYSDIEKLALEEFVEDSGSVLIMANPFIFEDEMRNYTSNTGQINEMLKDTYGELGYLQTNSLMLNDFSYRYNDQRYIYLNESNFDEEHSFITGNGTNNAVKELLTFTTGISATGDKERVVTVPYNTYYLRYTDEDTSSIPTGAVGNHTIISASEKFGGRAISICSGIMFSDIEIPDAGMTWFEAYDNAQLWENMISWLFFQLPVEAPVNPVPAYWIFALSILGLFLVLMVFGSIFFIAGKDTKRVEVSEALQKMREKDTKKEKEEKEIEEAFYAEDDLEVEIIADDEPEVEEPKEVDMKSISEEVKKKPPKTRSRSERRRQG